MNKSMNKSITQLMGLAALGLMTINVSQADELQFSAREVCHTVRANHMEPATAISRGAIRIKRTTVVDCFVPRNVTLPKDSVFLSIKPFGTGNNNTATACRVISEHPYGNDGAPSVYSQYLLIPPNQASDVTLTLPTNFHPYGRTVVQCSVKNGDIIYGMRVDL